ncbi:flavodoxin family protein [Candidatus Epulonipiscium viviparus]|uniref:flavodoxin family protein n=1 Tax=Candidatus Epulonipiscium viviparus TaxID=420336 RepID=UPI00016C01F7|nr:flavodoxin family protein [Candidatus Epulopiscium viviparus]
MKVYLVNGSAKPQGTTFTALTNVKESLEENGIEAEIYWIGNKAISGCLGCNVCRKSGKCILNDSVNEFAQLAKDADGFVFGSPVHYAAATGFITAFMDRLFYSAGKNLAYKPASAVTVARRGGQSSTFDQLNKYFTINQMPVVSSTYWNQVYGLSGEQTQQDIEGTQVMQVLGNNMAWLLKCIEAGKNNGIVPRELPVLVHTNFVR